MSQKQLKVFVNYRRADEKIFVEHLRTHFMNRYGRENVFMDFDSIPYFTEFDAFIKQKVRECDVVAMIVGNHWLELMQEKAAKGDSDYVRMELEEALGHGKVIAPICILGAEMPDKRDLPETLYPIAGINAAFVSEGMSVLDNISRIMNSFESELERRGAGKQILNPESQVQLESVQNAAGRVDIDEILDRFTEAIQGNDLPQALIWLAQLRTSGQAIPKSFDLNGRETNLQERLREEEERRRRREVADFQYKFVRQMVRLNDPTERIIGAILEIWQVDNGYIPDDLKPLLKPLLRPVIHAPQVLPPPFAWVEIPAGKVILEAGAYLSEATTFDVPAFAIAKYPVTNAQFQTFIDAPDGYAKVAWWDYSPDAQDWRKANRWAHERAFLNDDHPCANVTWYEAVAFCQWLSETTVEKIMLPTEQQWQRTAQGDDGRIYPWGNDWDCILCNNSVPLCKSSQTTSVTQYEGQEIGDSPFGVVDMSGNVWQWCLTDYETGNISLFGTSVRALRGGSWGDFNTKNFRVDFREWYTPYIKDAFRGFRLVRSLK